VAPWPVWRPPLAMRVHQRGGRRHWSCFPPHLLAATDVEVADMGASSPHAPAAGPQESTPLLESAAREPVLTVRAGSSVAQPAPMALHHPTEEGASGEAPRQEAAVPSPPTLAQVVMAMEAAVRDLRILQDCRDLSGELASRRAA